MILDAPVWCVKSLQVKHNCLLKKNTKYEQEQLDKREPVFPVLFNCVHFQMKSKYIYHFNVIEKSCFSKSIKRTN